MILIEFPDELAAALSAKAAEQGLNLAAWLQTLATSEATPRESLTAKDAIARILELQKHVRPDPQGWSAEDYIRCGRR